jgi:hypothetical protein
VLLRHGHRRNLQAVRLTGSKYGSGDIFFFETSGLAYIGVNCYWNGTLWVRNNTLNPARLFEFSPSTNSVAVYTVASGGGRTYQTSYIDRGIEAGVPRAGENVQANGAFTTLGDAQTSTLIARIDTVAAGDLDLTLDGVALAGVGNTITIEENKCFSFIGQVTARRDDGSEVAAWRFEGILNRQTGGDATISRRHSDRNRHASGWMGFQPVRRHCKSGTSANRDQSRCY